MTTLATSPSIARPVRRLPALDLLLSVMVVLAALGLVMAVSVQGVHPRVTPVQALQAHAGKLGVGLLAFLLAARMPVELLRRAALPLFAAGAGLVFLAAGMGHFAKGAQRWLHLGPITFQPVEVARFGLLVLLAARIDRAGVRIASFRDGILPVLGPAVLLAVGLLLQPDVGNALFTLTLAVLCGIAAGVPLRFFLLAGLPVLGAFVLYASLFGHVHERLAAFVEARPDSQVGQGLTALAAGGLFGQGLGQGWMKMGYVPEAENDFVFAIVGEELGLAGTLGVVGLFVLVGVLGCALANRATDRYRRFLIFGFTMAVCLQAAINLFVVTGLAPAKGIDLPLVSSGGTNLVLTLAAFGVIGNAARTDPGIRSGRV